MNLRVVVEEHGKKSSKSPNQSEGCSREIAYGSIFIVSFYRDIWSGRGAQRDLPTLELASVKLLSVVDLPDDGLPTRPIRGSRGMTLLFLLFQQKRGQRPRSCKHQL